MKFRSICNIYCSLFLRLLATTLAMAVVPEVTASCIGEDPQIAVDTAVFMREAKQLQEIIVNPEKRKYTKKNNPAVMLMKRVRAAQSSGDPRNAPHYSYDKYSKTTLGLLEVDEAVLSKHPFLTTYLDTTGYGKRQVLDILLKEQASTMLHTSGSKSANEAVWDSRAVGVATSADTGGLDILIDDLLRETDIFDDDVTLMSKRFPSPLSSIGEDYYKYYITDTLDVDGTRCVRLSFSPRNPESFSFMGDLYVALDDTTGFVKKVHLKVPRTINLNYVDNLYIDQTFEKDATDRRHKTSDRINLDLCIITGTQKFHAARTTAYSNFSYDPRPDLVKGYMTPRGAWAINENAEANRSFDPTLRLVPLSKAEESMGTFMARLREIPFFYGAEKVLMILVGGYIKTGNPSFFDIGPINTLISSNTVEGIRLRLGGVTTTALSQHWFAGGYVAYGTRDRKFKYQGELQYSFIPKKHHSGDFPLNSVKATYGYDVDMIGQHYLFTNADNVFLSWKRRRSNLMTYRRLARMEYNLELRNQLSFRVRAEHTKQIATPWLPFIDAAGHNFSSYSRTTLGLQVRYAPGEKYIQHTSGRLEVNRDAPVFILSHEWGPKNLLGSDFAISHTELSVRKRFWFSAFGSLDALLKGGIIWTQVPYPELLWPNANLSYTIQPESFSLMNPMEFAIDRYASLDLTYQGNGVLFNRIPVVKRAHLREVIGFKGLAGGLSSRNNPTLHPSLFSFPTDSRTRLMNSTPYMEISAGIDNIFTILRIDYVWRLTYRDTPYADRSGLRVALHFNF